MPKKVHRKDKGSKSRPEFRFKEVNELYGKTIRRLGGKPPIVEIMGEDEVVRKCVVRGKFTKKVWINAEDIVLVEADKFEPVGEIVYKYSPADTKRLFKEGHIKTDWVMKEPEPGTDKPTVEFDEYVGEQILENKYESESETETESDHGEEVNIDDI